MDIVEKLRSQIGDDVQHIFDHEALFRIAADEIARLRAENERLRDAAKTPVVKDLKWNEEFCGFTATARYLTYTVSAPDSLGKREVTVIDPSGSEHYVAYEFGEGAAKAAAYKHHCFMVGGLLALAPSEQGEG